MVTTTYLGDRRRWSTRTIALTRSGELPETVLPSGQSRVDDRAELHDLLARLPKQQRAAIVLRYYLDAADDEIAQELGCSAGAVRTYISRGLATLRIAADEGATVLPCIVLFAGPAFGIPPGSSSSPTTVAGQSVTLHESGVGADSTTIGVRGVSRITVAGGNGGLNDADVALLVATAEISDDLIVTTDELSTVVNAPEVGSGSGPASTAATDLPTTLAPSTPAWGTTGG